MDKDKLANLKPYSPGKTTEQIAQTYKLNARDIIKLSSNENPLGCSPHVNDYLKSASNTDINIYPDPVGQPLVDTIYKVFPEIGNARVAVGNGMDNILECLGRLFLSSDSQTIITIPTFSYYELITRWASAIPVYLGRDSKNSFSVSINEVIDSLNNSVDMVFLCSPNNPTGGIISWEDIEKVLVAAQKTNTYVFVDEAYIEYSEHKSIIGKVQDYPNLLVGRTFSKVYGLAALRIGWVVMHETVVSEYSKVQTPFAVNSIALEAAQIALEDNKFIDFCSKQNAEQREYLSKELTLLGLKVYPSDANFIAVDLGVIDSQEILIFLMSKGIIVRDITKSFQSLDGSINNMLRVTIGTKEQNKKLITVLKERLL